MAEKKNDNQTKRSSSGNTASKKRTERKPKEPQYEQLEIREEKPKSKVTPRMLTACVSLALFVLYFVTWLKPDGVLVKLFYHLTLGLFGQAAFYMAIPGFLLLFCIHAFSGKRPVLMRSICVGAFILIFSCIAHWSYAFSKGIELELGKGFAWVKGMYMGGISGTTSGLLCGGFTELLLWLLDGYLTLIALVFAGLLTFLGSFGITISSVIRAIENRPRGDWEKDKEPAPEPAALVVNHLAQKRIDHVENKRRIREEEEKEPDELTNLPAPSVSKPKQKSIRRAEEMLRQIEGDVDSPVASSNRRPVVQSDDVSIYAKIPTTKKNLTDDIPASMPQLENDDFPEEQPLPPVQPPAPAEKPVPAEPPKVTAKEAAQSAAEVAEEIARNEVVEKPVYSFPPIDLLKKAGNGAMDSTTEMRENTKRLNDTLASFRIEAHIINVTRGPSVTRYEVELDKGVRLNKLTTIADDIALSLGASGVRIAAVPGKISVVGIEVPNRSVTMVSLREVIDSDAFRDAKSRTSFAVGKDIGGNCIVGNIAKLPHMLIAGTTGSGKSVCMNSIIISLLYKASPDDVKLIMIDPKMVELGIYNSIPHLLIPVVTDPKKAAGSLQWAVTEMMRRYKAMSDAGVRDLESYNSIMESEETGTKLPQVVVVIDELADLMMVAAKEVEESICRIAQMGRASGIHLVIATQRPSSDVITGLMKANIPSRIAFAVASAMESRIILDTMGAEKLVGKGDMLFAPIGSGKPLRVQGCFVSDPEVEAVATYVKEHFNTDYDSGIMADIDKRAAQTGSSGKGGAASVSDPEPNEGEMGGDEMLPAAVDVILETNQASVSMLQRRLKLGYARAARIVDEMEEKGIVGPFQGSKPREILITKEQWASMKGNQPVQMELDLEDAPFDVDEAEDDE